MRRLASPGWIASHVFALAMVVLMANLGFWQIRRLDERRTGNAEIAAAMSQAPFDIAAHLDQRGLPPEYTAVAATGAYLADAEVRIGNRSSGGQPGFWLATPLQLGDGRAVAVVRGWIPRRSLTGLDDRSTAPPAGDVVVVGLAFDSVGGGRVAKTAEGEVPEISRMDLDRFAEVSGVDVEGVWIRLRAQSPPQPEGLPEPVPDPDPGEGPHLSYAFQWFFFSAGAIVVYGLILRRVVAGREEAPSTELQL
ncbi:MAG: SURF1 family protein [Acidimicrobiaceae bacterium]|nr:SURF1 family protein [Acidimicrobiaceae bacterium]MXZ99186.1 SURF1 family protein [Acidimicrobiaceae bacterium]MYE77036.1 SURF1 family protein [Acidimicrobiaceae bacterium]MYE96075.1 SURF1 family protein [Acidimicrobiaceae bacterium]MYH42520.1 SURF1 family protein [Acidimicrobiaceae bacterium]